jgi:putative transcriptional regulator
MRMTRKAPFGLAMLLGLTAILTTFAAIADDTPEPPEPIPGQLLIASAAMQDPRFFQSVILLLRHDRNGAFGIIINRPIGKQRLAALLRDADNAAQEDSTIEGGIEVFLGGPVQQHLGFLIHSPEYRRPETIAVDDAVVITASKEALRDLGHHQGPAKYLFAVGYAGWGAGQLQGEVARRDWFTTPAEPALIFDADRGNLWETALARRTRDL